MGSGRETEEETCEDRINRLIESRKMLFNARSQGPVVTYEHMSI